MLDPAGWGGQLLVTVLLEIGQVLGCRKHLLLDFYLLAFDPAAAI